MIFETAQDPKSFIEVIFSLLGQGLFFMFSFFLCPINSDFSKNGYTSLCPETLHIFQAMAFGVPALNIVVVLEVQ